ncbi:MAG: hypothetical protein GAK30_02981 [Paracidovorax wautersii]|uniref:Uncharacterized protein n=1 Tax=Paracidovorax wautersii TaxID=1177982 RepID=A0A7V8FLW8_9BURK|nr:MAG: hypothetical protein GAK30_02981 [Paracidovorax wautersii]
MSGYDNTNRGILSRNERKTSDKHPTHTGTINIEVVEYFIDAWTKERRDGSGKFFSLSVKRKDKQGSKPAQSRPPQQRPAPDQDDSVPF